MPRIANKVMRQIARYLGHEDAPGKITELREFLKEQAGTPEDIDKILLGFPDFLNAVMESYSQYEDQHKIAVRNLQLSSQELNELNRKLELLNSSMNAMLESLGQGLLFFDKNGLCSPVYSQACIALLEHDPKGLSIWDILNLKPSDAETFKTLISLLLDNQTALSFEDLTDLAPSFRQHSDGRKIQLEYRPMYGPARQIQGVLVIATDRSAEEKAANLLAEKEAKAARILRIAKNRNDFQKFLSDIHHYFLSDNNSLVYAEKDLDAIKRTLHTFKGLGGIFFMTQFAEKVHALEEALLSVSSLEKAKKMIMQQRTSIQEHMDSMISEAENLFGTGFITQGQMRMLPLETLEKFFHLHLQKAADGEIRLDFIRDFLAVPIWKKLEFFSAQIVDTADRLGKKALPCIFEGENFLVLEQPYEGLFSSLVHIANNIADHAIEPAADRIRQGKPPASIITVTTELISSKEGGYFLLKIEDDGFGISPEKIKEKLSKKGIGTDSMTREEIIMSIFRPDFSTAAGVTTFSGRGVGLNIVHEAVQNLGGSISVESQPGQGAAFIIQVPMITNISSPTYS